MPKVKAQQPPGIRSCAKNVSGKTPDRPFEWEQVEDLRGIQLADCFFRRSNLISPYSEIQLQNFAKKIRRKEKRATLGLLKFGPGNHNDVDQCRSAKNVLELKFNDLPHDHYERHMWFREYFAEPARQPLVLLRLHMNCKLSDDHELGDGHQLQTEDMLEAAARLDRHYK